MTHPLPAHVDITQWRSDHLPSYFYACRHSLDRTFNDSYNYYDAQQFLDDVGLLVSLGAQFKKLALFDPSPPLYDVPDRVSALYFRALVNTSEALDAQGNKRTLYALGEDFERVAVSPRSEHSAFDRYFLRQFCVHTIVLLSERRALGKDIVPYYDPRYEEERISLAKANDAGLLYLDRHKDDIKKGSLKIRN